MIHIAVCDDESKFRRNITQACKRFFDDRNICYSLKEYTGGEEFLLDEYPDILLTDITMHKVSGFLLRDILGKRHAKTKIIFIAENKNQITEAFGKNVYGFLLKPIHYDVFATKMQQLLDEMNQHDPCIYCKTEKGIEPVRLSQILCVEALGRYSKLYIYGDRNPRYSEYGIRQWRKLLSEEYLGCGKLGLVHRLGIANVFWEESVEIEMINGMRYVLDGDVGFLFVQQYMHG